MHVIFVFLFLGHVNWTIASLLSSFCSKKSYLFLFRPFPITVIRREEKRKEQRLEMGTRRKWTFLLETVIRARQLPGKRPIREDEEERRAVGRQKKEEGEEDEGRPDALSRPLMQGPSFSLF